MDFSTKIKMILESFLILHPEEPPIDYHRAAEKKMKKT